MEEKIMVSDALTSINGSLTNYANYISQTEHQALRQELIQTRNECEQSQYQLFQMAKSHGYYKPAKEASQQSIQEMRNICNSL